MKCPESIEELQELERLIPLCKAERPNPLGEAQDMDEATKLLIELRQTVRCTHLDMGGKNKYMLTIHSQSIIQKINEYLSRVTAQEAGTVNKGGA